jgi:hypothetical protein
MVPDNEHEATLVNSHGNVRQPEGLNGSFKINHV